MKDTHMVDMNEVLFAPLCLSQWLMMVILNAIQSWKDIQDGFEWFCIGIKKFMVWTTDARDVHLLLRVSLTNSSSLKFQFNLMFKI